MTRFQSPYPSYDILSKWDSPSWNDQTRRVIHDRLVNVPTRRFFDEAEWGVLVALCDRILPQSERAEPVPIAPFVDAALFEGRGSGTRFVDLPPDPAAWRQGLAALDAEAAHRHEQGFAGLSADWQDTIIADAVASDLAGPAWQGLPSRRFMRVLVLPAIVSIYYVHPAGQSEIGYGGPASPRGYVRLEGNRFDGWEAGPGTWPDASPKGGGVR